MRDWLKKFWAKPFAGPEVNSEVGVSAYTPDPKTDFTATVEDGDTEPAAGIDLLGTTPVGVFLPASLEGTTLSFKVSTSLGGTYVPMHDTDGNLIEYTVASSRFVPLDPVVFSGVRFLKPVLGAQTGNAVLTLATRRLG